MKNTLPPEPVKVGKQILGPKGEYSMEFTGKVVFPKFILEKFKADKESLKNPGSRRL
jgi:hypothetical protein